MRTSVANSPLPTSQAAEVERISAVSSDAVSVTEHRASKRLELRKTHSSVQQVPNHVLATTRLAIGGRHARKNEFPKPPQADLGCPVPRAKIFHFRFFRNCERVLSLRTDTRGVSRSSRTWSGMRRTRVVPTDERHGRGRRSRVVLARPCRRQVRAKLQRHRADDGGNRWFTEESTE